MNTENTNVRPGTDQRSGPTCTAPHPIVPFLFFLGTLIVVGLIAFYLVKFFG